MKDRSRIFVIFAVVVLALLAVASPLLAYSGVTGSVRDSLLQQGWQHGADVYVEIVTNPFIPMLISTCELDQTVTNAGDFDCEYGTNGLGDTNFVSIIPGNGDVVRVTIDFTCAQSTNCTGGNTEGTPATLQYTYTESLAGSGPPPPPRKGLGYIYTGTGPTAVELADLSLSPESINWGMVALVALLAAVTISGFVILRNRRTSAHIDVK